MPFITDTESFKTKAVNFTRCYVEKSFTKANVSWAFLEWCFKKNIVEDSILNDSFGDGFHTMNKENLQTAVLSLKVELNC